MQVRTSALLRSTCSLLEAAKMVSHSATDGRSWSINLMSKEICSAGTPDPHTSC